MGIKTGLLDGILADYVDHDMGLDPIRPTINEVTRKLTCKVCGFVVRRGEVRGPRNKYWPMKAKMIKHFHHAHPEIWAKLKTGLNKYGSD